MTPSAAPCSAARRRTCRALQPALRVSGSMRCVASSACRVRPCAARASARAEAHANVGVGVTVEYSGRDRPDLALGAFDQTAHRARGVEDERDLDGGLGDGRGNGGRQWQGGERERECADGNGWLHGSPPVVTSLRTEIPVASGSRKVENRARRGQIYG